MAQPTTLRFGEFRVWLEDQDNLGSYITPCGFTERTFDHTNATSDAIVPDCDNPDAAPDTQRAVTSKSKQVSGSGILALESLPLWRAWADAGDSRNIRVEFGASGANNGGYYQGPAVLSKLTYSASISADGGRAKISVQIDNDGAWTWFDAA